jgi:hypothetical protein
MAQNRHGWPFCLLVLRELIAGHHILLGSAGYDFFCQQAALFYHGSDGQKKWFVTVAYKMCTSVHPKPIIGCRDIPISRFQGTTEHQESRKCTEVHTLLNKGTTFSEKVHRTSDRSA